MLGFRCNKAPLVIDKCEVKVIIKNGKEWRVKFNGVYWRAVLHPEATSQILLPGDHMKVVDRQGLKLRIAPI